MKVSIGTKIQEGPWGGGNLFAINLRDYYFFSDYLKYKNDYKYKVNYPIRRLTYIKKLLIGEIMSKDNPHMNCTISSFSDYFKHSRIEEIQENWYDEVVSKIPEI